MTQYELSFITDPIMEDTENTLLDEGYFIERHGKLTVVTLDAEGSETYRTAVLEAKKLERLGVRVRRLNLDLVNQVQIAERVGVSKQAVQKWTVDKGSFPAPYTNPGGLLWAWSDVNQWLARFKPGKQDDLHQATPQDVARFDSMWECERSGMDVAHLAPQQARTTTWSDATLRSLRTDRIRVVKYVSFERVTRHGVTERVDA